MSAKNKIYVACAVWLAISAVMFLYVFKIFDGANQVTIDKIAEQKKQLALLQAQQESFKMAQQDLKAMAAKPVQPNEFFSKDVTLVKEIEALENVANKLGVEFSLNGLTGTVKSAAKTKSLSNLVSVPYSMSIRGPFNRVVDFIETMENLEFITSLDSLNLTSGGGDVSANLTAVFYLRKP